MLPRRQAAQQPLSIALPQRYTTDVIQITPDMAIDESELGWAFVRAGGPGGQHVNKVSTAVELRFDAARSPNLPDDVRRRLRELAGRRMTADGLLIIDARRFRSQDENRQDALARLLELLRAAATPPKPRRRTKPTRASREKRLDAKRRRSAAKRLRGSRPDDN